jgi:hypothetical protein
MQMLFVVLTGERVVGTGGGSDMNITAPFGPGDFFCLNTFSAFPKAGMDDANFSLKSVPILPIVTKMHIYRATKQTGGPPDEFSKEPVKRQTDTKNEPGSAADFSHRLSRGVSFLSEMQPEVESFRHWGLND